MKTDDDQFHFEIEEASYPDWACPACGTSINSSGEPMVGARAVSLHIAGKIRRNDGIHRQWALNAVGEIINESYAQRSINTLGDTLRSAVNEENKARREFEEEKLAHQDSAHENILDIDGPVNKARDLIEFLEIKLHKFVRHILEETYGLDETCWWVQGVPLEIRKGCVTRREDSDDRKEPYLYTYLGDLFTIIEKNWNYFEPHFRPHWGSKGDLKTNFKQCQ